MNMFSKSCRCSSFDAGMRVGEDGKLYCTRCGLPIDNYVKGFKEFEAEILKFPDIKKPPEEDHTEHQ